MERHEYVKAYCAIEAGIHLEPAIGRKIDEPAMVTLRRELEEPSPKGEQRRDSQYPVEVSAAMRDLDSMIGLSSVKEDVRGLSNLMQIQRARADLGLPAADLSWHLVFTGNPGTGKTSVARLLGQIYATHGILTSGHLVETSRSDLVVGFIGQSAPKMREVFYRALGGVLFIDEAYSLTRQSGGASLDFGAEVIDELVSLMELHRNDVLVIVAGYPAEMDRFISSNPGLKSRFRKTVFFPDYSTSEMAAIFETLVDRHGYSLNRGARDKLAQLFGPEVLGREGNGRLARKVFEQVLVAHATRVFATGKRDATTLSEITAEDIAYVVTT